MKRFFLMCGLVIALLLSGCGLLASHVETLKSWSFQYTYSRGTIRQEQLEIKQRKRLAAGKVNDTCSATSLFNFVDNMGQ